MTVSDGTQHTIQKGINMTMDFLTVGIFLFLIGSLLLTIAVWLAPIMVAARRQHKNTAAISILTLLAGWTFIGWIIALVWSFTD